MTIQLNLRMNDKLFTSATNYANEFGYENVQDFIRQTIREKVFEEDFLTSKELELAQRLELQVEKQKLSGSLSDIQELIRKKKENE